MTKSIKADGSNLNTYAFLCRWPIHFRQLDKILVTVPKTKAYSESSLIPSEHLYLLWKLCHGISFLQIYLCTMFIGLFFLYLFFNCSTVEWLSPSCSVYRVVYPKFKGFIQFTNIEPLKIQNQCFHNLEEFVVKTHR